MPTLREIIPELIRLRQEEGAQITLLAVCPNSVAVLEAAIKVAARDRLPMLFAATLNQVDSDGGYTGWTPASFVAEMRRLARKYNGDGALFPCLDHGGPWLKDADTRQRLSLEATTANVEHSLEACLAAGYQLLHIDATVDRTLPPSAPVPLDIVVARTVALIEHAERARLALGLPPVAYEVGSEEVHGGLVDLGAFTQFLQDLRIQLGQKGLGHAWPSFIVAQVGTDLHTTHFDPQAAGRLYKITAPLGSLVKGHYTDWVQNAAEYPATGMGGANVGPEFTSAEFFALRDLEKKEQAFLRSRAGLAPSNFTNVLTQAVLHSGRWQKWLQPDEVEEAFEELSPARRDWLVQTGCRYIWTQPTVQIARDRLYHNLASLLPDPHAYVVERIAAQIDHYVNNFGLFGSLAYFQG
jgi:tagatose-1,6-bisphosphate aldolase non-catalytic subunit AgaZ/GatZ